MNPTTITLVGAHEIEEQHGIPRYRIARFAKRGLWPRPLARLKCGDVYDAGEVETRVSQLKQAGHLT